MQDELKPVAWMHTLHMERGQTYTRLLDHDGTDEYEPSRTGFGIPGRDYSEEYAVTATPLYAHPPTTTTVDDRETPVGDHQMVEAVDRMLIEAIINDYHTTRLDRDYVPHILSKPRTVEAFARHRQAALTSARAQVEGENQRLREALQEAQLFAAITLAFIGRDRGSDRQDQMLDNLCVEAASIDDIARQALAAGEHRKDAP